MQQKLQNATKIQKYVFNCYYNKGVTHGSVKYFSIEEVISLCLEKYQEPSMDHRLMDGLIKSVSYSGFISYF